MSHPNEARKPEISVLMATFNRAATLGETLSDFTELDSRNLSWELIIVDNHSHDQTRNVARAYQEVLPIRYLYETRQGKNRALNAGVHIARGSLLVFVDDDISPVKTWLRSLWSAACTFPEFSVIGGSVVDAYPPGVPSWLPTAVRGICPFGDHSPFATSREYPKGLRPVGANYAIQRGRLSTDELRFSERFGPVGRGRVAHGEGELLCRLAASGHRMLFEPTARVVHRVAARDVQWPSLLRRAYAFGMGGAMLSQATKVRTLCGLPRYVIRAIIEDMLRCLWAFARGDSCGILRSVLMAARHCGSVSGRRDRDRAMRKCEGGVTCESASPHERPL